MESDPVTEWSSDQLGLEEPMWQLGLGGDEESELYPERPDEADCIYYLRTGFCGYGSRCRFNHPRDRGSVIGALRGSGGEYPERIGRLFVSTICGRECANMALHASIIILDSRELGHQGEKECSYYVKTGQCKFGVTCKFHHPQPAGMVQSPPLQPISGGQMSAIPSSAMYQNVQSPSVVSSQPYGLLATNWPAVARSPLVPGSYLPGTYGPMLVPPGMIPFPGWNPYQAPVHPAASPNTQPILGSEPAYAMTQLSPSAHSYALP